MNTPVNPTIAVFGATGNQGSAVIDALLEEGATVRGLVRQPGSDRAQALADRGVELAYADVEDPPSLSKALAGVDAFFFMTTIGGHSGEEADGEASQGITLADAAAAAGVRHVVFDSVGGAERQSGVPHFESKRRVEEHLETLSPASTIVRPVFFMENLASASVENGEVVVRLPLPDGIALQMVAVRDVGQVAAAALLGTAVSGGVVEIAGDERTGSEIAAAFAEHTGLPARYEALPLEVLDGQDDIQRMFRWFAETPAYRADFAATRSISPDAWDLPAWLAKTGWSPSS
ncbi:NmrA/HSCARG family protein [Arthrobacter castelli]|uniref:NmrA/HSCARG family protein n=1 Tax=Arthrobacter castelli TaxID=271431 RepID=UPI000429EC23|nr:NmrA/HSCARG family protein [Arthrobacter castelli]